MRKRYQKPETLCINVQIQQIMAGSISQTSGADGLEVGGDTEGSGISFGNSRRSNIWDYED